MKAKTRILAMLLTVLMIGGLLPLSLFAVDGVSKGLASNASQVAPADRTLDEIEVAFKEANFNLALYQSFQKWGFEAGTDEYAFPRSNGTTAVTNGADYISIGSNSLRLKNGKGDEAIGAYSVVTEEDGNVALYLGSAPVYNNDKNNDDNFIDFDLGLPGTFANQAGNGSHDFYVSVDLKMNGPNITSSMGDCGLFALLYREGKVDDGKGGKKDAGASLIPTVTLSDIGGLYLGGTADPDKLIGFLSENEYTRVALATNRAGNKYYVYINDVLVNPEGTELFSPALVSKMQNSANKINDAVYTAQNFPICNLRMYLVEGNIDVNAHKGLFFDNFLGGTRMAVNKIAASYQTVFATEFPASLVGGNVATPLPKAQESTADCGGVVWPGAIKYFKEDDGTVAMQWHKCESSPDENNKNDQAYIQVNNSAPKGSNLRFSLEIKLGEDGIRGDSTNFFFFRSGAGKTKNEANDDSFKVGLDGNGKLVYGSTVLGYVTKDKYTNLTVDIVCNGISGTVVALFFVDGKLVHTTTVNFQYNSKYRSNEFHPDFVRIYPIYDNTVEALKENDLKMRSVSLSVITDYNSSGAGGVFDSKPVGITELAGISRYYNADGSVKTEDFVENGEKYLVSYNGIIIGKESDGIEFAPYAPYVDYDYGTTLASSLDGGVIVSGTVNSSRDAFQANAKVPGIVDGVKLYTSYYDYGPWVGTGTKDCNSYTQWDIPNNSAGKNYRVNSSLVLDFDVMMGQEKSLNDISRKANTFFNFVGKQNADGSGSRADTQFLRLSSDGWVSHDGQNLVKINKTEFTRLSFVIHTPTDGAANGKIDVYANGVLLLENIPMNTSAKNIESIRFFSAYNQDLAVYIRDAALYDAAKPRQFYTLGESDIELTDNADKTPVKASDIKKGFVSENGVVRYYGETGLPTAVTVKFGTAQDEQARLPMVDKVAFTDQNGRTYKADKNGIVYAVTSDNAMVGHGYLAIDYNVNFNGLKNGDYGYAAIAPTASSKDVFGITFNKSYCASGKYDAIAFDLFLSEQAPTGVDYTVTLGETVRYYKVKWLGENKFEFGDGSYVVDAPEGMVEFKAEGSYTIENGRGGEKNIVLVDTDDVPGISRDDTFYAVTRNGGVALSGSFSNLTEGVWNTVEVPIIDNGKYDIDSLSFATSAELGASVISGIKISEVRLVKATRLIINSDISDGVAFDGCYYKNSIAQVGWIDENGNSEIDAGDYYANPNTLKIVKGVFAVDGVWYKFDNDGKLVEKANTLEKVMNGFDENGNALYAYKKFENGAISLGLLSMGASENGEEEFLYTDPNGFAAQNVATFEIEGAVYSFDADGIGKRICENAGAHTFDEGVVTKLSTCKTPGEKTLTCSKCGYKKTEALALDPNFHEESGKNGIATCCAGVKADGVTSLYGYSISIGKNVVINFYLELDGTEGELEIGRRSEFIGNSVTKVSLSDVEEITVGDKTYKIVSVSVPAHAVDAVVRIRYVRPDGYIGSVYEYNVQQYLDAIKGMTADETYTAEVIELVKAFDVYAKNVNKVVFDSDVAVETITDVNEMNFETDYAVSFSYNDKNVQTGYIRLEKTYDNISFEFGETMKVKVNFALTGVSSDFKFYVNGEEAKGTLLPTGLYCVEAEIKADKLDEIFTIKITHAGGSECVFTSSALACAKRMFMSNTSSSDEKNLMKAIYKYSVAIDTFVASLIAE